MSDTVYSPMFKQVLRKTLYDFLYVKPASVIQHQILEIGERNRGLLSSESLEFVYRGESFLSVRKREYIRPSELHVSLKPEMDKVLKMREDIKVEEGYTLAYITKVLNSSSSLEDYLALFPDSLHPPIQKLIENCPCKNHEIDPDKMVEIVKYNAKGIELTKKRLLQNLLM